jgi:hypothetical protein
MKLVASIIVAGAFAALIGCAPTAQPAPGDAAAAVEPAAQSQDPCGAARYRHLIGRSIDTIDASAWPARSRVICFGCMATMDYVAERLTVQLGPDRKVASMRCG